ncbi:hemerythrin domain-containing protein [Ensifer sp. HO-A22]|uniref:Hemerythrin domain-containing protein n=1 Tax=Ensifer oleiphilus TaxID=2742698 RepID=A0A7Y6Q7W4_9HYPH|nr:hemerythrin domain-containing protein [Ensifer oleiphilus]NVD40480.1 hemerythrin domain-containing protein [Ensifer oleiphilus]
MSGDDALEEGYQRLLRLCDDLEAIADSLPRHIDPAVCRDVAARLPSTLLAVHRLEDKILFPAITAARYPDEGQLLIDRLRDEHRHDTDAAGQVARVLKELLHARSPHSWEAIGYMLRAFFETVRRHVATERLLLEERI